MKRVASILLLLAGLATGIVFLVRPTTQATPDVTITVNSTADTNVPDAVMTLREAMLMATGDLAVDISNMGPLNKFHVFVIRVTAPVNCPMPVAP